ncbi:ATP-binding protein [Paenibacillus lutrae]|uniref:AAA domain-containing protein n=1 Tax=Paenibacillus lutrae TaxID=2078573 RepID=A0A7X3JZV0_9BACL|nr:MoxR family ATPase [Paenibacillus lutrae]MVP00306.1 AAA domain-containing protein [Paenibacillus lutrae]
MTPTSAAILEQSGLPEPITQKFQRLNDRFDTEKLTDEEKKQIGTPGFVPARPEVLQDAMIALALGKHVLLKGPTGSGKTKLAEHLSFVTGQPLHSVNCSTDLDAEALLGFKTLNRDGNETVIEFVPGPVVTAMTRGHILYIDEINMAKPDTLPLINGVLDHRRSITNPFTGEIVRAHADFRVIAAINEGYIGTVPLNEALKNRFVAVEVPYLQGEALLDLLLQRSLLRDTKQLSTFVALSADLLTLVEMGQLSDEAASVRALIDACDLAAYMPAQRAIERAIAAKLEDERERAAVRNVAETLF